MINPDRVVKLTITDRRRTAAGKRQTKQELDFCYLESRFGGAPSEETARAIFAVLRGSSDPVVSCKPIGTNHCLSGGPPQSDRWEVVTLSD